MHWGKTGWPESGFVGASEYPGTFCDFGASASLAFLCCSDSCGPGCAVREVDPTGKFRSMSPVWTWAKNDMEKCCSVTGYDHAACACN